MLALLHDRFEAGRILARQLMDYAGRPDTLVLALPRGGVPVGFEVAWALGAPLDVLLVRKLGVPGQEELAMGAIASDGSSVLNREVVTEMGIPAAVIKQVAANERKELSRRERYYRGDRPPPHVAGRITILVDDGLATGSTMHVAALALRGHQPARIVIAVPVAAATTAAQLRAVADEVVCVANPEPFYAVGQWYEDFSQTTDDEVRELLAQAATMYPCEQPGDQERAAGV